MPEWIEYEIDAFSSGQLCGRDEVRVPRDEHNLVYLFLEAQGCDVKPDSHIDAFLKRRILKIVVGQSAKFQASIQQFLQSPLFQTPISLIHEMTESKCNFTELAELIVQG